MGRCHVGCTGLSGPLQVKGEVLNDLLSRLPFQGPAVQQHTGRGVACDRHHIRPECKKCLPRSVSFVRVLPHGALYQVHRLFHVPQIIAHRVRDLGHCLRAAGARILNRGAAVMIQKQQDTAAQNDRHHPHHHGHQNGGRAQTRLGKAAFQDRSPAFSRSRRRRMALGDSPQYFLKQ